MTILSHLPQRFEHPIVSIDTIAQDDKLTEEFVKSLLLQPEQRWNSRTANPMWKMLLSSALEHLSVIVARFQIALILANVGIWKKPAVRNCLTYIQDNGNLLWNQKFMRSMNVMPHISYWHKPSSLRLTLLSDYRIWGYRPNALRQGSGLWNWKGKFIRSCNGSPIQR